MSERKCAVCGKSLDEAEAAGEMTSTLSATGSDKVTHICSSKCWDEAFRRLGIKRRTAR